MQERTKKVCYVLSYSTPNYIRTKVLLQALEKIENIKLFRCINKNKGVLRYLETLYKLFITRIKHNPDVYILGFRGNEIFWPVRVLTLGKTLIFDEFICSYDYYRYEHNKNKILAKIISFIEKSILKFSDKIITDTNLLKKRVQELYKIDSNKISAIYVGTDEENFEVKDIVKSKDNKFIVFFYGTILPLHGIDVILDSAEKVLSEKNIKFTIIGGKGKPHLIEKIRNKINNSNLKNIDYKEWVQYEELPNFISESDLCLGGPFGDTMQAHKVITGKAFQFLAMGKPTVIGKIDEEVGFEDKRNCLFVKIGDSEDLAEKIFWAYQNQDELKDIGKKGKELYKSTFSIENIKNELIKIL